MLQRGGFKLHKWHSNEQANNSVNKLCQTTFWNKAKENLKLLGLLWDKREDSFIIQVPNVYENAAKQNILITLLSIYDPLGFVLPCLLLSKITYRNLCDLNVPWDKEIHIDIQTQWLK